MTDDAPACTLTRDSAAGSERLYHGHTSLQANLSGLLHLAVDVKHGCPIDEQRVASVDFDVIRCIAGQKHLHNIDLAAKRFPIAHSGNDHDVAACLSDAASRREHACKMTAGRFDRVPSGSLDLTNYRYETA